MRVLDRTKRPDVHAAVLNDFGRALMDTSTDRADICRQLFFVVVTFNGLWVCNKIGFL